MQFIPTLDFVSTINSFKHTYYDGGFFYLSATVKHALYALLVFLSALRSVKQEHQFGAVLVHKA